MKFSRARGISGHLAGPEPGRATPRRAAPRVPHPRLSPSIRSDTRAALQLRSQTWPEGRRSLRHSYIPASRSVIQWCGRGQGGGTELHLIGPRGRPCRAEQGGARRRRGRRGKAGAWRGPPLPSVLEEPLTLPPRLPPPRGGGPPGDGRPRRHPPLGAGRARAGGLGRRRGGSRLWTRTRGGVRARGHTAELRLSRPRAAPRYMSSAGKGMEMQAAQLLISDMAAIRLCQSRAGQGRAGRRAWQGGAGHGRALGTGALARTTPHYSALPTVQYPRPADTAIQGHGHGHGGEPEQGARTRCPRPPGSTAARPSGTLSY